MVHKVYDSRCCYGVVYMVPSQSGLPFGNHIDNPERRSARRVMSNLGHVFGPGCMSTPMGYWEM